MKKRHQLRLVGITYNQIESGVYAVILEEVNGDRRIPIVIGYPEAQSIECHLQQVRTPRPLTHDLMKSIITAFGLHLSCVVIDKLPTGVFAADIVMEGPDGGIHNIDSRSSDAIAIAVRTGAPIYTSTEVLEECGFRTKSGAPRPANQSPKAASADMNPEDFLMQAMKNTGKELESFDGIEELINSSEPPEDADTEILDFLNNFSDKEIERQIGRFAAEEKYEVAARLKSLLKKRNEQ